MILPDCDSASLHDIDIPLFTHKNNTNIHKMTLLCARRHGLSTVRACMLQQRQSSPGSTSVGCGILQYTMPLHISCSMKISRYTCCGGACGIINLFFKGN